MASAAPYSAMLRFNPNYPTVEWSHFFYDYNETARNVDNTNRFIRQTHDTKYKYETESADRADEASGELVNQTHELMTKSSRTLSWDGFLS